MNSNTNEDALSIKFPNISESATINKDVKILNLINKTVQVTYSLN